VLRPFSFACGAGIFEQKKLKRAPADVGAVEPLGPVDLVCHRVGAGVGVLQGVATGSDGKDHVEAVFG